MKHMTLMACLCAAMLTIGCDKTTGLDHGLAPGQGITRSLGDTTYPQAFAAARQVFSQYYSIQTADPITGKILGKPKKTAAQKERLISGSPAREIATLYLTEKPNGVIAQCYVQLQRQGSDSFNNMGFSHERRDYGGNPGRDTPAGDTAATTAAQNEEWQTQRSMPDIENKILQDIQTLLHGE